MREDDNGFNMLADVVDEYIEKIKHPKYRSTVLIILLILWFILLRFTVYHKLFELPLQGLFLNQTEVVEKGIIVEKSKTSYSWGSKPYYMFEFVTNNKEDVYKHMSFSVESKHNVGDPVNIEVGGVFTTSKRIKGLSYHSPIWYLFSRLIMVVSLVVAPIYFARKYK